MAKPAIRCTSLTKRFGSTAAVHDASLSLDEGRILALLGPSGCGKTTLLRLLAGFEVPDAGVIEIGGRIVASDDVFVPPERRRVGIVFQDYALFPHLNVADNVTYGLLRSSDRRQRLKEILSLVGLSGYERRMPHELSGGEQQRVAIARALVPSPEVVLLDEPFSNLDAALRTRLRGEVRRILKAAGATAILVTHDQEEAVSLADEVAVMLAGRIEQVATPESLYYQPASKKVATFVGDADFLPGTAVEGDIVCELGRLQCQGAPTGMVEAMLRPEDVDLALEPSSPCEIVGREFYGRDQLLTVRLPSGRAVRARLGPRAGFAPGDRVVVQVNQAVKTFPSDRECAPPSEGRDTSAPAEQAMHSKPSKRGG